MAKSDRLEEFINAHLREFETVESPNSDLLWHAFDRVQKKKRSRIKYLIAACISAVLIATSGLISFQLGKSSQTSVRELLTSEGSQLGYYDDLLKQIDDQRMLISEKSIPKQDHADLFSALYEVEHIEVQLKIDLAKDPNEPAILRALLQQYERKAKLLRLILFEYEKKETHDNLVSTRL